jgi:acyl-CoA dehydrogenase
MPDGPDHVRIDGVKTWISNGGIADHYVVFARSGEAPGAKGLSAYVVDAQSPGLIVENRIDVIAPHPLATLRFDNCRVPLSQRIGGPGEGFKVAMATLDVFRSTVGAAALGLARRALSEALQHAASRKLFGAPLGDLQMTQASLADMATGVDSAALLVYRAAWTKDQGAPRVTREAAMAKMHATETAQGVIDKAVQIFGGLGVTKGVKVEELYREIRALRIYEGASEVQKMVIAREVMKQESSLSRLRERVGMRAASPGNACGPHPVAFGDSAAPARGRGDQAAIAFLRLSSILSRKPVVESHFWSAPTRRARSLVM